MTAIRVVKISHEEGGLWLPFDGKICRGPLSAAMFSDGSVWDFVLNRWREKRSEKPRIRVKAGSEPCLQ